MPVYVNSDRISPHVVKLQYGIVKTMLQLSHVIFFLFQAQVLSQRSRARVSNGSQAQSRSYLDVHRIFGNCVSQRSIQHIIGLALENIFQSVLPSIQCSGSDPRSIWPIHKFICSPAPYCNQAIHTESQLHVWTTIFPIQAALVKNAVVMTVKCTWKWTPDVNCQSPKWIWTCTCATENVAITTAGWQGHCWSLACKYDVTSDT